ncbi:MAG TPA: hypothetical protein VKQ30_13020 [Ktedonobacterales bacterium]|nr:hypothetical protein [Ktedonobacterales bacterium]
MSTLSTARHPTPLNQLSEPTKDNHPDENPRNNCTFASLAWVVRDIGSEPDCDGDEIHDECEGQGHTGPYDPQAAAFAAAARKRGVALTIVRGTGTQLVARLHAALAAGADALINIPSEWGTAPADPLHPAGTTHCVAVAYPLPGGLRCMNPWGGFWHDGDDAYWAARICYGYILLATADGTKENPMLDINDLVVKAFFALVADGGWLCAHTGQEIHGGILAFYREMAAAGSLAGLTALGLPKTGEIAPKAGSVARVQLFERGAIAYDPHRELDAPPGATGDCYLAHVDSGAALTALEATLHTQLAAAQDAATLASQQRDQAVADAATARAAAAKATSDMQAAEKALASAQDQLNQAEGQLAEAQKGMALAEAIKAVVG